MDHYRRIITLAALTASLVVLTSGKAYAEVDMGESYQPRLLPSSRLFFIKRGYERVQLALTFGGERKTELKAKLASKRLGEFKAMVGQGETKEKPLQYAITVYQQELNQVVNELGESIGGKSADLPVKLIEEIRKMTARHEAYLHTVSLSVKPTLEAECLGAAKVAEEALDLAVDARGDKPLPDNFIEELAKLSASGLLSAEEVADLLKSKNRRQAREGINDLIKEGKLTALESSLITAEEIESFDASQADKMMAALHYRAIKSIAALPQIVNPTAEVAKQIQDFMQSYQPGTTIPEELKKYVIPQIRGIDLSAHAPFKLAKLDLAMLRPADQKIFQGLKKTFFDALGDTPPTQPADSLLPIDLAKARELYLKIQDAYAEQTGFKEYAKLVDQLGDEEKAKKQFYEKYKNEFNQFFDHRVQPPGWEPEEWDQHLERVRKHFYGVKTDQPIVGVPVSFRAGPAEWAKPAESFQLYDPDKYREKELEFHKKYLDLQLDYEKDRQELFLKYDQKRQEQHLEFDQKRFTEEKKRREEELKLRERFQGHPDDEQARRAYEEDQRRLIDQRQKHDLSQDEQRRQQEHEQYRQNYTESQQPIDQPADPASQPSYPAPSTSPSTTTGPSTEPTHTPTPSTTTTQPSTSPTTSPTGTSTSQPAPTTTTTQPLTEAEKSCASKLGYPVDRTMWTEDQKHKIGECVNSGSSSTSSPTSSPTPTHTTDNYALCASELGYSYPYTQDQYSKIDECVKKKEGR